MSKKYVLNDALDLNDFTRLCSGELELVLSKQAESRIKRCAELVDKIVADGRVVYGINTGFGGLSDKTIDRPKLQELQVNLIRSTACGVGKPVGRKTVRGMILLLVNSLAKGYSGAQFKTVDTLVKLFNSELVPVIPQKGSLGASGDLAPLAHLALILIGEGRVMYRGKTISGRQALKKIGCAPVKLNPKEGLALVNGTHLMASQSLWAVWRAQRIIDLGDKAAAMSMEALRVNTSFLNPKIHRLKKHPGQIAAARSIKRLIRGSRLVNSIPGKVQDAYCLRCIPQVHGAARDLFEYAKKTALVEMNSVTDNPLIMPDGTTVSGGNFHGQALALAMDSLALAVAEIADISERRTSRLVDDKLNHGLPPFLIEKNGVNSGFMVAQYTAASLVAENKIFGHPASVDSIPTSANQEDHVSLGSIAARKIHEVCFNAEQVLMIELLCAAQGLDFTGPDKAARYTRKIHNTIREIVPHVKKDRVLSDDILKICGLIKQNRI